MFCTFVLQTVMSLVLRRQPSIYELLRFFSSVHFQTEKCPYHCLGFSLEGFTAFHSARFQADYVTVALSRSACLIHLDVGISPAVSCMAAALAYGLARHEHYRPLSRCEHGLSSTHKIRSGCLRTCVCHKRPVHFNTFAPTWQSLLK